MKAISIVTKHGTFKIILDVQGRGEPRERAHALGVAYNRINVAERRFAAMRKAKGAAKRRAKGGGKRA